MIRLPPRLRAVADRVPPALPMADIGTDHGLLPIQLLLSGKVPRAFALDRAEAPLARAVLHAAALGLDPERGFVARRSRGLSALEPGEAHTITLAGLGGATIAGALDHPLTRPGAPGSVSRIVAQPNLEPERVRAWAARAGWRPIDEEVVEDAGRLYVIVVLEPGPWVPDAPDLRWGPLLRARRPAGWLALLAVERAALQRALEEARREGSLAGAAKLEGRIAELEALIAGRGA